MCKEIHRNMCQNPHQLMTSEILSHFILDKCDELDCKPAMYWWFLYGHKWVIWSGTSPTGLNSGWKMLQNPKPQSSVAPPRVASSRNGCSCKTQGSVAGSQCWPWGAMTALSREYASKQGVCREGKAKPSQHFHVHSQRFSKALFPPTWADLHTLWTLPVQNWWRWQCFSWLQLKRLSPQVTECCCRGVWCKTVFCHAWSMWKYSEVYLHILYPKNAEKGEIKTVYSWRYWAAASSDG